MALIICSWSGGIDSTALIGQLLKAGHSVQAVTLNIYGGDFGARELEARSALFDHLAAMGSLDAYEIDADWIWEFSPDGVEIPRRNRHIIDHLAMKYASPAGTGDIGLGEYIGADTWVVRDHVGAADADARALAAYLYHEYGLDWRLWTLSDFGEARFKHNRLDMGFEAGVPMDLTTNCLGDYPKHCGQCYKCIERSVAFNLLGREDRTEYLADPKASPAWRVYHQQMIGIPEQLPAGAFPEIKMPRSVAAQRAQQKGAV